MEEKMFYVPDGTEQCGYYECKECDNRFLDLRIAPQLVCPYCGEEVEKMDALLSLAITGGDYDWL